MTSNLLLLSALLSSTATAFGPAALNEFHRVSTTSTSALIFGWDGQEEDASGTFTATPSASPSPFSYVDIDSNSNSCSPLGMAVAESLSYDPDRVGHLARLAVAFCPPNQALTLDKIERVDVICVHDDSIDIQAILCQEGGCVSLSVPVQFPKACFDATSHQVLEGCVLQNLQELDVTAGTLLQQHNNNNINNDPELEASFHTPFEAFPNWWVPPHYYSSALARECQTIQQLLNEDEFQADVNALAQDALKRTCELEAYRVQQAKVASVGPAGICLKVRAAQDDFFSGSATVRILEVIYPFDFQMTDGEALRAAVLGAVASV